MPTRDALHSCRSDEKTVSRKGRFVNVQELAVAGCGEWGMLSRPVWGDCSD
jgi:hypothetical protein